MKPTSTLSLIAALSLTSVAFAQSAGMGGMGGMDMQDKQGKDCMAMKDMDMKGMDAQKCRDMMKGMDSKSAAKATVPMSHETQAVVKGVDAANGKVTLAHEPVKSLGWPAMTMGFVVKDKALFDKLPFGKRVHVEFAKEASNYVVTSVK